ncbi:MAG: hypothetical protein GX112_03340 [Clostridiaceae bacterium]|jgi:hypothetical protein|nr:hypothetical protein [Clostridiaceae bacterium]
MKIVIKKSRRGFAWTFATLFLAAIFGFGVMAFVHPAHAISISERRKLALLPAFTAASLLSGTYFRDLETFMLDQFPWRDQFLRIKAFNQFYVYRLKDNHNIFIKDQTAVAISYPFAAGADELAARKMSFLIDTYFQDMNVYLSVIPDKAFYLAARNGYPAIDYETLLENLQKGCAGAAYSDIFATLTADDYYRTDSHWRQECLSPTVARLLTDMKRKQMASAYDPRELYPFYGVYCGQSALPLDPDTLTYLTGGLFDQVKIFRSTANSQGFEASSLYDPDMIAKNDPYDVFLGGACSVVILENPRYADDTKELYLFSDSFGRSIAPQLLEGYSRVVLIDIRYIRASRLPDLVHYQPGSDVLFLYSIETLDTASSLNTD